MAKKLLLVNLLVLGGVYLLAQHLVASWRTFEGQLARTVLSGPGPAPELVPPPSPKRLEPVPQFMVIAEKDLFRKDRGAELGQGGEGGGERAPKLPIKPELIGVSVFGDEREAVLNVYQGKRSKAQRRTVKLGDEVQLYRVSAIEDDLMKLAWNDYEIVIDLNPAAAKPAPKKGRTRSRQAVNIITVGSAGSAIEKTTVAAKKKEKPGLEVAVVGARPAQGGARGTRGRRGLQAGAGGRQGAAGLNQGRFGSRLGGASRSRQTIPGNLGVGSRNRLPSRPPG
ncbi:MAG: hypothetical protein ACE5JX_10695 [Acidobacteriota bacterium]